MKITLITVGKIKEKYLRDAIAEYSKRLSRYCKLVGTPVARLLQNANATVTICHSHTKNLKEITRMADILIVAIGSPKYIDASYVKEDAYVITLEINGKLLSSEELSAKINQLGIQGTSHITFIIGGSIGLGKEVLARSDYALSFSKMTFPHQLMRVILLEQIYRSYRIINGEPYHK